MSDIAGVGIDLTEVARLRALLERRPAAAERLFTPAELQYCRGFADPVPRLAARFAVKEAVGKALGTGVIVFLEIEVEGGGRQRPQVRLHGATAAAARGLGIQRVEVSLSHTAAQAAAVAAAVKEGGHV
jgi:holo-[acyl-carrier protein] synthase